MSINKETKRESGIFGTSSIIAIIVTSGKILGFIRETIIAALYGATWQTDAFFYANSMPMLIFPSVCSSFSTAFISLYISKSIEEGKEEGERFASRMLVSTLFIALIISIISVLFAPIYVRLLAPGFSGEQLTLTIHLTRLTMGSFVLTMAQYMLSAILNSKQLYYGSQMAGLGYNVVIIIITVVVGNKYGISALTISVIFGHLVQVLILMKLLHKKIHFSLIIKPFHPDTKMLIKFSTPILLSNSLFQIGSIIDKFIASSMQSGAVSALSYSSTLDNLVISIFITTLSTVLYPKLSHEATSNANGNFSELIKNSIFAITLILIPISIITAIFSSEIISIVYERGSFDSNAAYLTSTVLMFAAIQYPFYAIREVINRGFYAKKDSKTPLIYGGIGIVIKSILSIALSKFMGIGGISLSTSISMIITALMMLKVANMRFGKTNNIYKVTSYLKLILAGIITTIFLTLYNNNIFVINSFINFIIATFFCFTIYVLALIILRSEETYVLFRKVGEFIYK